MDPYSTGGAAVAGAIVASMSARNCAGVIAQNAASVRPNLTVARK